MVLRQIDPGLGMVAQLVAYQIQNEVDPRSILTAGTFLPFGHENVPMTVLALMLIHEELL